MISPVRYTKPFSMNKYAHKCFAEVRERATFGGD